MAGITREREHFGENPPWIAKAYDIPQEIFDPERQGDLFGQKNKQIALKDGINPWGIDFYQFPADLKIPPPLRNPLQSGVLCFIGGIPRRLLMEIPNNPLYNPDLDFMILGRLPKNVLGRSCSRALEGGAVWVPGKRAILAPLQPDRRKLHYQATKRMKIGDLIPPITYDGFAPPGSSVPLIKAAIAQGPLAIPGLYYENGDGNRWLLVLDFFGTRKRQEEKPYAYPFFPEFFFPPISPENNGLSPEGLRRFLHLVTTAIPEKYLPFAVTPENPYSPDSNNTSKTLSKWINPDQIKELLLWLTSGECNISKKQTMFGEILPLILKAALLVATAPDIYKEIFRCLPELFPEDSPLRSSDPQKISDAIEEAKRLLRDIHKPPYQRKPRGEIFKAIVKIGLIPPFFQDVIEQMSLRSARAKSYQRVLEGIQGALGV